ncbi:hypothetical protein, partial [Salmonella enterica]|uniref:hypothetical protein n=1 Tax=Salmonella enterica TaxID=28901 RepID=UPI001E4ABAE2
MCHISLSDVLKGSLKKIVFHALSTSGLIPAQAALPLSGHQGAGWLSCKTNTPRNQTFYAISTWITCLIMSVSQV